MSKPFWVHIGMLGIKTRSVAKIWLVASLGVSILFAAAMIFVCRTFLQMPILLATVLSAAGGLIISLSSLWYWLCIRWMDKNDYWQKKPDQSDQPQ